MVVGSVVVLPDKITRTVLLVARSVETLLLFHCPAHKFCHGAWSTAPFRHVPSPALANTREWKISDKPPLLDSLLQRVLMQSSGNVNTMGFIYNTLYKCLLDTALRFFPSLYLLPRHRVERWEEIAVV